MGFVKLLVEAGDGRELAFAEEPFPARVEVVDGRGLEVRVAGDLPVTEEVVIVVGGQLAHLGPADRRPVRGAQQHRLADHVFQRDARQHVRVGPVRSGHQRQLLGRVVLRERAARLHLLAEHLQPRAARGRQPARERRLEHQEGGVALLRRPVAVVHVGLIEDADDRPDALVAEQRLRIRGVGVRIPHLVDEAPVREITAREPRRARRSSPTPPPRAETGAASWRPGRSARARSRGGPRSESSVARCRRSSRT